MKTLVLTGAAGFIGGYVAEEALNQGYKVIGIDNLMKYGRTSRNFGAHPNYEFRELDARDADALTPIFAEADHIIAGAAMIGGISYFHSYEYDLLANNERIIAATCDAALQVFGYGRLKKVTYISSSMVFESTNSWPSKEGDERNAPPPKSSYGFQKLAVEYFAKAAWDQYNLPFTILRPFNCVGIGESRALGEVQVASGNVKLAMSHVVPDLVQKIIKGQDPVHLLGTGKQIRCYTYGGDLAKGIISSLDHEGTRNEDFNLSTPEQTTVVELGDKIWHKIHGPRKAFRYILEPGFSHDVQRRIPSVDKAKQVFGFKAETPLDDMLDECIPWIRNAINLGWI